MRRNAHYSQSDVVITSKFDTRLNVRDIVGINYISRMVSLST
jgi:hypothetical protein